MTSPQIGAVFPGLSYNDAEAAIEWLCRVLGFTQRLLVPGPNGGVLHSELSLGEAVIMVSSIRPEQGRLSPMGLEGVNQMCSVHIADPDAHHARAVAGGAQIMQPLSDEDFGSRGYGVKDLEGHLWYFSTYKPGSYWS
jgi:uncharacterized glyoxalase superfamily protein PhnB